MGYNSTIFGVRQLTIICMSGTCPSKKIARKTQKAGSAFPGQFQISKDKRNTFWSENTEVYSCVQVSDFDFSTYPATLHAGDRMVLMLLLGGKLN